MCPYKHRYLGKIDMHSSTLEHIQIFRWSHKHSGKLPGTGADGWGWVTMVARNCLEEGGLHLGSLLGVQLTED